MRSEVQVFPGPPLARPTILCARVGAIQYGAVAQLGERLLCKQEVVGSIPSGSTNFVGFAVWFRSFGRHHRFTIVLLGISMVKDVSFCAAVGFSAIAGFLTE